MKKLLTLTIAIIMTLSLAACGDNSTSPTSTPATVSPSQSVTEPSDNTTASTADPTTQDEDPASSDAPSDTQGGADLSALVGQYASDENYLDTKLSIVKSGDDVTVTMDVVTEADEKDTELAKGSYTGTLKASEVTAYLPHEDTAYPPYYEGKMVMNGVDYTVSAEVSELYSTFNIREEGRPLAFFIKMNWASNTPWYSGIVGSFKGEKGTAVFTADGAVTYTRDGVTYQGKLPADAPKNHKVTCPVTDAAGKAYTVIMEMPSYNEIQSVLYLGEEYIGSYGLAREQSPNPKEN